jgi:hypothetical protein
MLHENGFELDDDTRIIKHKHRNNFTMICNACINDENLLAGSLAILIYVMSKPDDWKIIMKDISKRFAIGRDKTYNIINKLIELGYMKRFSYRNGDGSLAKTAIFASDDPIFLSTYSCDKQPLTENQEVVVVEQNDKQPLPGFQDPVNQEVVPYIQKKDLNKENNNNKILSNPIGECEPPPSDKVDNIYPESSVVVFFMKKIEGSGVSESTLVSWLRKYGTEYVAEKIRIYQTKGAMTNPGGFLSAAMLYDWKEGATAQAPKTAKSVEAVDYPTLEQNRIWFRTLSDSEKIGIGQLAVVKHYVFDAMLSNAKLSVLDEGFPDNFLFKVLMELLGRAKR